MNKLRKIGRATAILHLTSYARTNWGGLNCKELTEALHRHGLTEYEVKSNFYFWRKEMWEKLKQKW